MVWHVAVELNDVARQGRSYPWKWPEPCLRCGRFRVWGHGFVGRYFDGFARAVLMKCFRCPGCGCVVTTRPAGYFRRIRSAVASIRSELRHRLEQGRWLSRAEASRKRHWLTHLRRQALAWLGWTDGNALIGAFDRLVAAAVVAVGRTIQTANRSGAYRPQ